MDHVDDRLNSLKARFTKAGTWGGGDKAVQEYCIRGIRKSGRTTVTIQKIREYLEKHPSITVYIAAGVSQLPPYRKLADELPKGKVVIIGYSTDGWYSDESKTAIEPSDTKPHLLVFDENPGPISINAVMSTFHHYPVKDFFIVRGYSGSELDTILNPPDYLVFS